ncbi:hypothetical protein F750_0401 [Streptomyces sp. PAMC 26508]|nr:hypothetical protein F750_0401 [Streptomyces sp. PAMC 26508]
MHFAHGAGSRTVSAWCRELLGAPPAGLLPLSTRRRPLGEQAASAEWR